MSEMPPRWSPADACQLYDVHRWGSGYFGVNSLGNVCLRPAADASLEVDLKELVERLRLRGVDPPMLLRFGDVIKARLAEIHDAFQRAIDEHEYRGSYCCVYPIKVNQQREVVEEVLRYGRDYQFGLEVGSKPELLAVIAMADNETRVICNGFKDAEYIETTMLARKMGRLILPVVERYGDLELILEFAEQLGVRPEIGMRVKLAARGSGRWSASGGYRSKFGLTVSQLLRGLEALKARGMAGCLKLLHFHLGSQITNIQRIKAALTEAARVYVELVRHGAGLHYLDVGGGLGVDYDGSQTDFDSSVNYSLQEYANDVVHYIQSVCDDEGVEHPTIISESGRAVVAHHSVLVFNVLGVAGQGEADYAPAESLDKPEAPLADRSGPGRDFEQPLHDLHDAYHGLSLRNLLESFHDAQQALDMAMGLFAGGYLPLEQRCAAENYYWAICRKIQQMLPELSNVPEDLQRLDRLLCETYYCNFSLFQSLPDSWGMGQLFPVMPIHRLDERPDHHAVLADLTCDSCGKIDRFIDLRDVKRTLPLHAFGGEPYYLGVFLVGAYQEILGDLHNLFGDTNAVHVHLDEAGQVVIDTVVAGDKVHDVLRYVNFDPPTLQRQLRTDVETAVREQRLTDEQAGRLMRFYEEGMRSYTYLQTPG